MLQGIERGARCADLALEPDRVLVCVGQGNLESRDICQVSADLLLK